MAAYEHIAMIKLHYKIADVIDACMMRLETGKRQSTRSKRPVLVIPKRKSFGKSASLLMTPDVTKGVVERFNDDENAMIVIIRIIKIIDNMP